MTTTVFVFDVGQHRRGSDSYKGNLVSTVLAGRNQGRASAKGCDLPCGARECLVVLEERETGAISPSRAPNAVHELLYGGLASNQRIRPRCLRLVDDLLIPLRNTGIPVDTTIESV